MRNGPDGIPVSIEQIGLLVVDVFCVLSLELYDDVREIGKKFLTTKLPTNLLSLHRARVYPKLLFDIGQRLVAVCQSFLEVLFYSLLAVWIIETRIVTDKMSSLKDYRRGAWPLTLQIWDLRSSAWVSSRLGSF